MYRYIAYTNERKIVEGTIESTSEHMAEESLYRAGFQSIISIRKEREELTFKDISKYFSRISEQELIEFTSELATLIESGFTLLTALKLLQAQATKRLINETISQIIYDIQNGKQFHEALAAHPKIFANDYLGIIQASERAGTLSSGLSQISEDMKRRKETKSKVRRALLQPAIVVVVAIIAVFILTIVVFPPLAEIFKSFEAELPIGARIMIAFTDFMDNYVIQLVLGIIIFVIVVFALFKMPGSKEFLDRYLLKIPLIGTTILWNTSGRLCRTMGGLINAGIILPEAINMTVPTINNSYIKGALRKTRSEIIQGKLMSDSMRRNGVFPMVLSEMISIGENSGQLEQSFMTMAEYYENKMEGRLYKITTLLEPALILTLGLFVGFLAVSVISTMYTLPGVMTS